MSLHLKVFVFMFLGVLVGFSFKFLTDEKVSHGIVLESVANQHDHYFHYLLKEKNGVAKSLDLPLNAQINLVSRNGKADERTNQLKESESWDVFQATIKVGDTLWLKESKGAWHSTKVILDPNSLRAKLIAPFIFFGDIFLSLLKMLMIPLVLLSIMSGVSGLSNAKELKRLGLRTFLFYVFSSLLAIIVGQILVNLIAPGDGAQLGLNVHELIWEEQNTDLIGIIKRMVPQNIFSSVTNNSAMLQVIFFALLFGFFMTKTGVENREKVRSLIDAILDVMMQMAQGILTLIPYGVFVLIVKMVSQTGLEVFAPLALYMLTVVLALAFHAGITLSLLLKFVAQISPIKWFQAMSPALLTAFSTASSSMTLPMTLDTVQKRGGVSTKVSSFTLPLGATINMDGTALYECIGVIFLAQYYASQGVFTLELSDQLLVVLLALLASVGAAGIPSAGLVMMLTILSALHLPIEGAALLLAVDRPLDMLRTTVNVWSDSCAAAVIASGEGEFLLENDSREVIL